MKTMEKASIPIFSVLLCSCAFAPNIDKESTVTSKSILFPSLNEERIVKPGESLVFFLDYESVFNTYVEEPVVQGIVFGTVNIQTSDVLAKSTEAGSYVLCPFYPAYSDISIKAPACGVDSNKSGYIDKVRARPSFIWLTRELSHKIKYSEREDANNSFGPMKRELVFEAYQSGTLLVTYREFAKSLASASLIQPLSLTSPGPTKKLAIKGAEIEVLEATSAFIRYRVTSSWPSTLRRTESH